MKMRSSIFLLLFFNGIAALELGKRQNPSDKCAAIDSENRILTSKNFPNDYPTSADCSYEIANSGSQDGVELMFYSFELEGRNEDGQCASDYMEIFNDEGDSFGKFCGIELSSKRIDVEGTKAIIVFHSDVSLTREGFKMFFESSTDTTQGPVETTTNALSTSNYEVTTDGKTDVAATTSAATVEPITAMTTGSTPESPTTSEFIETTTKEAPTTTNLEETTAGTMPTTNEIKPTTSENIPTTTSAESMTEEIYSGSGEIGQGTTPSTAEVTEPDEHVESGSQEKTASSGTDDLSVVVRDEEEELNVTVTSPTSSDDPTATTPTSFGNTNVTTSPVNISATENTLASIGPTAGNESLSTAEPLNETSSTEAPMNTSLGPTAGNESLSTAEPFNETSSTEAPSTETEAPTEECTAAVPASKSKAAIDRAIAKDLKLLAMINRLEFSLDQIKAVLTSDMVDLESDVFATEKKRKRGIEDVMSGAEDIMGISMPRGHRIRRSLEDDLMSEIMRLEAERLLKSKGERTAKTRPGKIKRLMAKIKQ